MRLVAGQFRELTQDDLRFARQIGCSGVMVNKPDLDSPAWIAFLNKQFRAGEIIIVDVEDDPEGRAGDQRVTFRAMEGFAPPSMELAEAGPGNPLE